MYKYIVFLIFSMLLAVVIGCGNSSSSSTTNTTQTPSVEENTPIVKTTAPVPPVLPESNISAPQLNQ